MICLGRYVNVHSLCLRHIWAKVGPSRFSLFAHVSFDLFVQKCSSTLLLISTPVLPSISHNHVQPQQRLGGDVWRCRGRRYGASESEEATTGARIDDRQIWER